MKLSVPGGGKLAFKGIEAYSWKGPKGAWQFALLGGTNDFKAVQNVKVGEHVCASVDRFVAALKRLPADERVLWSSHNLDGFELPPKDVVERVKAAAREAEIELSVSNK